MNMQGIICGSNNGEISNVSVVFTKDIVYRGSLPSGMDGSMAVFGSYNYYGKDSDYGTFTDCKIVVENGVTNAKAIYFCCKATSVHNYTFNNCEAISNGIAAITIPTSKNGSTVKYTPNANDQEIPESMCVVIFDSDSSAGTTRVVIEKGTKLTEPPQPTKTTITAEYEFKGWFNGSSKWDFENGIVTGDMTLVAHWEVVGNYTEPVLPKD